MSETKNTPSKEDVSGQPENSSRSSTKPIIADTIDSDIDQILCDLYDLGFHGDSLAHLEKLAEYILKSKAQEVNRARLDEVQRFPYSQYWNNTKMYKDDRIKDLTPQKG